MHTIAKNVKIEGTIVRICATWLVFHASFWGYGWVLVRCYVSFFQFVISIFSDHGCDSIAPSIEKIYRNNIA